MKNLPIAIFAYIAMSACGQPEPKQTTQTTVPATEDTLAQMPGGGPKQHSSANEQLFRTTLAAGDHATLEKMIRFPLQTAPKWSNEDLRNAAPDTVSLKLTEKQFPKYKDNIFSPDIKSALEKENGEDVREIAVGSEDDYYSRLRAGLDSSAPLYEAYHQFLEKDGSSDTYFAFIFGKVGQEYKLTGFYTKWPIRD